MEETKRLATERAIYLKCKEIMELMKDYNPDCDYLSIALWVKTDYVMFNNDRNAVSDIDYPINYHKYRTGSNDVEDYIENEG